MSCDCHPTEPVRLLGVPFQEGLSQNALDHPIRGLTRLLRLSHDRLQEVVVERESRGLHGQSIVPAPALAKTRNSRRPTGKLRIPNRGLAWMKRGASRRGKEMAMTARPKFCQHSWFLALLLVAALGLILTARPARAGQDAWTPFGLSDGSLRSLTASSSGELYVTASFGVTEV